MPDTAQNRPTSKVLVQPDFYYERENRPGVCIFIDGPHHNSTEQQMADSQTRSELQDFGFRVITIRHDQPFMEQLKEHQDVFVSTVEADDARAALHQQFAELVATWRAETAGLSSPRSMAGHPAYQQIIAMGEPVIPFIFRDMKENGGWWYPALRALTGANPVPESAKRQPATER